AFGPGSSLQVNSNSQVRFAVPPGNLTFFVGVLGCISGPSNVLGSLSAASISASSSVHPIIGHETHDPLDPTKNPSGIFAAQTQYIYGISADFNSAGGTESIS